MSCVARPASLCVVCKCSLDVHAPHAVLAGGNAHLDCADAFDSRAADKPADPSWKMDLPGMFKRQAD